MKTVKILQHPTIAISLVCMLLLAIRVCWCKIAQTAPDESPFYIPFLFLAWNLCLAWIPWQISLQLSNAGTRVFWLGFIVWLLFLPNAPYLVTDLMHLRHRAPIPLWYDALLFFLFAVGGWALGCFSLVQMDVNLRQHISAAGTRSVLFAAILLSGLGIYIGRFRRWNSWDALLRPDDLLTDLVHSFMQGPILFEALFFSGLMAALLGLSYWVARSANY